MMTSVMSCRSLYQSTGSLKTRTAWKGSSSVPQEGSGIAGMGSPSGVSPVCSQSSDKTTLLCSKIKGEFLTQIMIHALLAMKQQTREQCTGQGKHCLSQTMTQKWMCTGASKQICQNADSCKVQGARCKSQVRFTSVQSNMKPEQ